LVTGVNTIAGAADAADASQAAYFRGVLADEREQVADNLARSRLRLRACAEREKVIGLRTMARLRCDVRELEARQRELDRLIAALDRRFSALSAARADSPRRTSNSAAMVAEVDTAVTDVKPLPACYRLAAALNSS
jgi:hypothetical protein